jgi:hypothetical protein
MKTLSILSAAVAFSAAALCFGGAAEAANLFFEGDMVRGSTQDGSTGPSCVLTSQYKRLEHVVWRVRVRNEAGENVDNNGLKSLAIQLSDGQTIDMRYGKHPRGTPTDEFWATSWGIPADYPTGTIGYKVIATDLEGSTHEWSPFIVESSQLTIIPGEVTFTK